MEAPNAHCALSRPPAAPFFPALLAADRALVRARSAARFSGSAMRLRPLSRLMQFRPAALHAFGQ